MTVAKRNKLADQTEESADLTAPQDVENAPARTTELRVEISSSASVPTTSPSNTVMTGKHRNF